MATAQTARTEAPGAVVAPARQSRLRRARTAVPAPLAWLLAVVAVAGLAWTFVSPPFLVPDEDVHFAYVQSIAERGARPGDPKRLPLASDEFAAVDETNINPTIVNPYAQPDWSRARLAATERRLRRTRSDDGGGPTLGSAYPPASYLYDAAPYLAASGGDVFDRFYAVRLGSVLWLLVTTLGAWLLAGEMFGRNRLAQLVAAASVGLWPMIDFMSASVSPDPMSYALCTVALWLGVSVLRRRPSAARAVALGAAAGLAPIAKTPNLAVVPPVLAALAVVGLRHRRWAAAAAGVAALLVPIVGWGLWARLAGGGGFAQATGATAGAGAVDWGQFLSYLWQFYLPTLGFQEPIVSSTPVISSLPAYNTWLGMGSGAFGWASVWFPPRVYLMVAVALAAVLAGAAVSGWRWLRRGRPGALAVVFLASVVALLLAGLHWTDYRQWLVGVPFAQGRYLFPVAGVGGLLVGLALRALPERRQPLAAAGWLAALVVFQVAALGLVLTHFHA